MIYITDPGKVILLASAVVLLLFGFFMLGVTVPKDENLKNYRTSRVLLSCAYILLGIANLSSVFSPISRNQGLLMQTTTLIVASLQSFFFTFSLVALINLRFIALKRFLYQIIPISIVSVLMLFLWTTHIPGNGFQYIFFTAMALYACQLAYYVWFFRGEYKKYQALMDDYFTDNESRRLIWIRKAFYIALSIGILTILFLFVSHLYTLFTIFYTLFYVYYAMKYLSYLSFFRQIKPAILPEPENKIVSEKEPFYQALIKWKMEKRFIEPDITLDSLSLELQTNRTYLSNYINREENRNFRSWISMLRIEEAISILKEHPDQSFMIIGERVGIADKKSFHRQFLKITGMTPGEYRLQIKKTGDKV